MFFCKNFDVRKYETTKQCARIYKITERLRLQGTFEALLANHLLRHGHLEPIAQDQTAFEYLQRQRVHPYVFTKFAFCTEKGPRVPAGRQLKMWPLTKRTGMFGVISEGMLNRSVEPIKALCTALEGSTLEHFCDGMLIWTEIRAAKSGSEVRKQCLKGLNKPKNGSLSQRRLGSDFIKCMKL